jgi:hypothetical protein
MSASAELVTEKIREHVKDNWLHQFTIDAEKSVLSEENFSYRRRILEGLFATLFVDRSVLVLDEASGIYPALIKRAGARSVAASSANAPTRELIAEVADFLETPTNVIDSHMVGFYDSEPYVDMAHGGSHEFLLALNQIWPLFRSAGQDFEVVVEACSYIVSDGLVFDWTDAEWASPPPPAHYTRAGFCAALAKRFDYVTCYSDWLIVAAGKLPEEPT